MDGYEDPGSYSRKIKYDINMEQIVAIINQSQRCEQFIKYECHMSGLYLTTPHAWWVSRDGAAMYYWGGAEPGSRNCACGMTNTCISQSETEKCNCDQNIDIWTEDSGYLIDKSTLPVNELRLGDTAKTVTNGDDEIGYHTLGKLQCWG